MDETKRQFEHIRRNAVEIIEERELLEKLTRSLRTGKPLRVKYGIDPTAPDIHLGHTVPIRKLRDFQQLGHTILFLIGDFTARIGDPTGRRETRPILTPEEIQENLSRYREQAGRILNLQRTEFVYNSSWLSGITMEQVIRLCSIFTVAQILEREDFSVRYREGKPVYLHEFLYPLLQGYDSVALNADVEIGATEQKFNLLAGRTMQEVFGQEKQVVITMPILVGTDGTAKMSKSYNNHIPLQSEARDMFGKIMSIPDRAMEEYFSLLTGIPQDEYRPMVRDDPRQAKARLAGAVVSEYFGEAAARTAESEFDSIFRKGNTPSDIQEFILPDGLKDAEGKVSVPELLASSGLVPSRNESKRLILQGAVELDGRKICDPFERAAIADGQVLKVGKRRFLRIRT